MRFGFTTGSCAAAAAKAAAYMLLFDKNKLNISIQTPKGIFYDTELLDIKRDSAQVTCAVKKDGGDDPDVTTGALIYATVSFLKNSDDTIDFSKISNLEQISDFSDFIEIDGGIGVGRVTRPGLDQPIGNAAINHVPRQMIAKEVLSIQKLADYKGKLRVEISVPDGVEIAKKTFNERLGIEGGISILGTSGIVEPMSQQALLDTILVELKQKKAEGYENVVVSPGNYGMDFMKNTYGYDLEQSVKCSNFIGDTIDMVKELGFSSMLFVGHIGKLIKLAGGIMNTHSKEGDCRMELIAAAACRCQVEMPIVKNILECVATEEAICILKEAGVLSEVMQEIISKIMFYLKRRAGDALQIECIVYANEFGELAKSEGAKALL